jgi:hypothetical protein
MFGCPAVAGHRSEHTDTFACMRAVEMGRESDKNAGCMCRHFLWKYSQKYDQIYCKKYYQKYCNKNNQKCCNTCKQNLRNTTRNTVGNTRDFLLRKKV